MYWNQYRYQKKKKRQNKFNRFRFYAIDKFYLYPGRFWHNYEKLSIKFEQKEWAAGGNVDIKTRNFCQNFFWFINFCFLFHMLPSLNLWWLLMFRSGQDPWKKRIQIFFDPLKGSVIRILFIFTGSVMLRIQKLRIRIRDPRLSKDPRILSTNSLLPYPCEKDKRKSETKVELDGCTV